MQILEYNALERHVADPQYQKVLTLLRAGDHKSADLKNYKARHIIELS